MPYDIGEEKRRKILRAIEQLGGVANTSQIRETSGLETPQINYHLSVLRGEKGEQFRDDPLVEHDGQEQLDGVPIPANIYRLTDAGRDAAAEIDDVADPEKMLEQLEQLREDHEQLKSNFNQLLERIEKGELQT